MAPLQLGDVKKNEVLDDKIKCILSLKIMYSILFFCTIFHVIFIKGIIKLNLYIKTQFHVILFMSINQITIA